MTVKFKKIEFLFNLHTREHIHRRYFVACPSIHAVGGFLPITRVSMIYTNIEIFQEI